MENILSSDEFLESPSYNFYKMGFINRNVLYNLSDLLSLFVIGLLLIPVVTTIKLLLPKNNLLTNIELFCKSKLLITLLNLTYLKISFACFYALTDLQKDYETLNYNIILSLIGVIYLISIMYYYIN